MKAEKFVEAYPYTMTPAQIHRGGHSVGIEEAQTISYRFGRLLHASLSDIPPDEFTQPADFNEYEQWGAGFADLEYGLLSSAPGPNLRAFTEINFHRMNLGMRSMWKPIIEGQWKSEGDRLHRIRAAQQAVSVMGFIYYSARADWAEKKGVDTLFDKKILGELGGVLNGVVQELDAAVVLLGLIRRHPNLTVVPAPLNFERTRKGTNVDHVVADMVDRQAVGVQVKTNARESDIQQSDSDRVVFIDGTTDFDNVMAHRTDRRKSTERVVPWAGMISAKMVSEMKVDRKSTRHPRNTPFMSRSAKRLAGHLHVDLDKIIDRIEPRILNKLRS